MTLNKVTIKTIAKKINVSPATVSKALRDSHDISDQTKLKIKNLAKKLGYKPNLMARNLVSKKSNIIGVIVPDISTSFFGLTVRGINYAARKHNYEVIILVNDEDHKVERKNIEFISNLQVDGILIDSVPGNHNLDLLEELSENGMPIVFVDRKCKKINADSVTTDDIKAGYTITKYFLKNNKSKIVFVGDVDLLTVANDRVKGYKKALKEFGIKFDKELLLKINYEIDEEQLKEKIRSFIHSKKEFDSFICAGGVIAYLVGLVLLEEGFAIPDGVLLGEFGDNNIVYRLGVPFITVDQSPISIGATAFDLLVTRMKDVRNTNAKRKQIYVKSKLVSHHPAKHEHLFIEHI